MSGIVVYSAITGGYDEVVDDGRVVLLDDDIKIGANEEMGFRGNVDNLRAKHPKVLPHLYFPEYEYSVWIDGNVSLKVEPEELVETFLEGVDWAVAKHYNNDCAYREGEICMKVGRGTRELIVKQMVDLYDAGFPRKFGLWENCMLIRRHGEVKEFSEAWWGNILRGSERDQISFPFTVWQKGLKFRQIDINVWDRKNPYLIKHNANHNAEVKPGE